MNYWTAADAAVFNSFWLPVSCKGFFLYSNGGMYCIGECMVVCYLSEQAAL